MGYRHYIGYLPKRNYNKIKNIDISEYNQLNLHEHVKMLVEFGSNVEFSDPPKKSTTSFFKNKEVRNNITDDYSIVIVTNEFLAYVIGVYNERIKNYYSDILQPIEKSDSQFMNSATIIDRNSYKYRFDFSKITDDEQTALYKMISHMRSMNLEWNSLTPYDINDGHEVTTSWKFEYSIFNIVEIYKTFDWKKNIMIYYQC